MAEGGGHALPNYFKIVGFSEILMLCPKIFGVLLFIKINISNFIGKSLNLPPPPILQVPGCLWHSSNMQWRCESGTGRVVLHLDITCGTVESETCSHCKINKRRISFVLYVKKASPVKANMAEDVEMKRINFVYQI